MSCPYQTNNPASHVCGAVRRITELDISPDWHTAVTEHDVTDTLTRWDSTGGSGKPPGAHATPQEMHRAVTEMAESLNAETHPAVERLHSLIDDGSIVMTRSAAARTACATKMVKTRDERTRRELTPSRYGAEPNQRAVTLESIDSTTGYGISRRKRGKYGTHVLDTTMTGETLKAYLTSNGYTCRDDGTWESPHLQDIITIQHIGMDEHHRQEGVHTYTRANGNTDLIVDVAATRSHASEEACEHAKSIIADALRRHQRAPLILKSDDYSPIPYVNDITDALIHVGYNPTTARSIAEQVIADDAQNWG